jgi:succinate dehydrogenase/fumarate reductase flavoprotein subunit
MVNNTFDFSLLSPEAHEYLAKSDALFGLPIDRLRKMNTPAIELYRSHGIDLEHEPLEIAICVQHNNGGLVGDIWWESNLAHLFPIGEANGSFGVYRPGGSALNSTQVGSLRAAQYIHACYAENPPSVSVFAKKTNSQVLAKLHMATTLAGNAAGVGNLAEKITDLRVRMTRAGGAIRNTRQIEEALADCRRDLNDFPSGLVLAGLKELPQAFRLYDMLLTQFVYLSAIAEYIRHGGQSRGSYLIQDAGGQLPAPGLPEQFRYSLDNGDLLHSLCEVQMSYQAGWHCQFAWHPVKPIPPEDNWFEKTWAEYRAGKVFAK